MTRMIDVPVSEVQPGDTVVLEGRCSDGQFHLGAATVRETILPDCREIDVLNVNGHGFNSHCFISRRNIISAKRPAPERRVKNVEWAVGRKFTGKGFAVHLSPRIDWLRFGVYEYVITVVNGDEIEFSSCGVFWRTHKRNCDLIERRSQR